MIDDITAAKTAALLSAQRIRDVETGGHIERVAAFAWRMGQAMYLPTHDLAVLVCGAQLHDVGKIGTPDQILHKPGKHTPQEQSIMRRHVMLGGTALRALKFPGAVVEIVEQHHERWDGNGYPQGLKATRIALGARVFAVADTLDAMLSDRCYRAKQSYEAARDEIVRCTGAQFDPAVTDAFLSIRPDEWVTYRQIAEQSAGADMDWTAVM